MLRRVATAALAATALLALPGCLKMKESMAVKKDGSGTMTMKMVVDTAKMTQLQQMMGGMGGMGGPGGGEGGGMGMPKMDRAEFDKKVKELKAMEGVTLVSHEFAENAETGAQSGTFSVAFDSLQKLVQSDVSMGTSMTLVKNADGSYTLSMSRIPKQAESMPSMDDPAMAQQKAMIEAMVGPFLEGLEFSMALTLPTKVISVVGGEINEDGAVVWNTGAKEMFTDPKKAMTRAVTFSGEGLDWAPFEAKSGAMAAAEGKVDEAGVPGMPVTTPSTPATPAPEAPKMPEAPLVPEAPPSTPEPVK